MLSKIGVLFALSLLGSSNARGGRVADLSKSNRRDPIPGLPDWRTAGYGSGKGLSLPDDSQVCFTITPKDLATKYGVRANDGKDDTDGLNAAIASLQDQPRPTGSFALIQLPPGKLQISHRLSLNVSWIILRGAGSDPKRGGTVLEFKPDNNTIYDVLTADGSRWDQSNSGWSWEYVDEKNKTVKGTASGGWSWPGRAIIHVASTKVAPKYEVPYSLAPANRADLFRGTVNYHFRNDSKVKGFMADQTKDLVGKMGDYKIYYDGQNTSWPWAAGNDVYVYGPTRSTDYDSWNVTDPTYYVNAHMFQDWFTVTSAGSDASGTFLSLDHPLRFDVYSSSIAGGAAQMENATNIGKVMPVEDAIHHVGIENLYVTQPMDEFGLTAEEAVRNYGNLAPERAMHGILFRFARDCWVRGVRTYMLGSHPIVTESARHLTIQDNYFDGAWNKGAGGNGYIRASRVFDSVFANNELDNLRHFSLQWSSAGNIFLQNKVTSDINLHGGWESSNLVEGNIVRVPYDHGSGHCTKGCDMEEITSGKPPGTWFPIYWSAGAKASKWAGATGPQNVFFNNVMQKARTPEGQLEDFTPYYESDNSTLKTIFEFGWNGKSYQHLSLDGVSPLPDWSGNEQAIYKAGVLSNKYDHRRSLFLKDPSKSQAVLKGSKRQCRSINPPSGHGHSNKHHRQV